MDKEYGIVDIKTINRLNKDLKDVKTKLYEEPILEEEENEEDKVFQNSKGIFEREDSEGSDHDDIDYDNDDMLEGWDEAMNQI